MGHVLKHQMFINQMVLNAILIVITRLHLECIQWPVFTVFKAIREITLHQYYWEYLCNHCITLFLHLRGDPSNVSANALKTCKIELYFQIDLREVTISPVKEDKTKKKCKLRIYPYSIDCHINLDLGSTCLLFQSLPCAGGFFSPKGKGLPPPPLSAGEKSFTKKKQENS